MSVSITPVLYAKFIETMLNLTRRNEWKLYFLYCDVIYKCTRPLFVCFLPFSGCLISALARPPASFVPRPAAPLRGRNLYILIWIGPTVLDLAFDRPQTVPGRTARKRATRKCTIFMSRIPLSLSALDWTNSTCQISLWNIIAFVDKHFKLYFFVFYSLWRIYLTVKRTLKNCVYKKALYQFNGVLIRAFALERAALFLVRQKFKQNISIQQH